MGQPQSLDWEVLDPGALQSLASSVEGEGSNLKMKCKGHENVNIHKLNIHRASAVEKYSISAERLNNSYIQVSLCWKEQVCPGEVQQ